VLTEFHKYKKENEVMATIITSDADAGRTFTLGATDSFTGTSGVDKVNIDATATNVTVSGNGGADVITMSGNVATYTVAQDGSRLVLTNATGGKSYLPLSASLETLNFADVTGTQIGIVGGQLTLGSQVVNSATPTAITGTTPSAPANTFKLTTSATDNLVGTTADESFTGVNSSSLADGTLQVTDKIDGGTGNDSASFDMYQGFTGFTTGSMKNVETVNLTNKSVSTVAFDATGVTNVTKYVLDATAAAITLSNVATLADLEVTGNTKSATFSVGYAPTSVVNTGSQVDTQNLKTTNVGSGAFTIAGVEKLALNSAGTANSLDLSNVSAATITATGSAATTITGGSNVTSFDASAVTGKVTATLTNAASGTLTSVKTGTADDVVTIDVGDLKAGATLAGGTGNDTLVLSGTGGTIQPTMSGFETVSVSGLTSGLIFSGTNVTDVTAITTGGSKGTDIGQTQQFVNMGSGNMTVTSVGGQGSALTVDTTGTVTYNLNAGSSATSAAKQTNSAAASFDNTTSLTVNAGGGYFTDTGAISAASATSVTMNVLSKIENSVEQSTSSAVLTAASASSFTVNGTGGLTGAAEVIAAKATTGTVTTAAGSQTLKITAAKLNTLNVTANGNLDITGSTLTALQNLTLSAAGTVTPAIAMADAAIVNLSGGTSGTVTLGNLGATTLTHNVSVTSTGLNKGVTVGNVDAGTATATLNVTGAAGAATAGTIDGDAGVVVTATNVGGALTVGNMTTTVGSISVDVSNAAGAVSLGTLSTNQGTDATTSGVKGGGDVTLLATNALGNVTYGNILGNNVTVNTKGVLGTVTEGTITAGTSVTYTASNLQSETVNINQSKDGSALTATLSGGAKNETFNITGLTKGTGVTVKGDLGAGTNTVTYTMGALISSAGTQTISFSGLTAASGSTTTTSSDISTLNKNLDRALTYTGSAFNDTISLVSTTAANITKAVSITDATLTDSDTLILDADATSITFTNLSLSGIENIKVGDAASTVTINASAITGQTITLSGKLADDILNLSATPGADVVDLSKIAAGATAGSIVIDMGAGADTFIAPTSTVKTTVTGGDGNDTITLTDSTAQNVDTYIFNGTVLTSANANNMDTITGFYATSGAGSASGDVMQFCSTLLGGYSFTSAGYATIGSAGASNLSALGSDIVVVSDNVTGAGTSTAIAALFSTAFSTAANQNAILIADDGTNAYVWYVSDSLDGTNTTLSSTDYVLIGTLNGVDAGQLIPTKNFSAIATA
jgi:hypothetical protein